MAMLYKYAIMHVCSVSSISVAAQRDAVESFAVWDHAGLAWGPDNSTAFLQAKWEMWLTVIPTIKPLQFKVKEAAIETSALTDSTAMFGVLRRFAHSASSRHRLQGKEHLRHRPSYQ